MHAAAYAMMYLGSAEDEAESCIFAESCGDWASAAYHRYQSCRDLAAAHYMVGGVGRYNYPSKADVRLFYASKLARFVLAALGVGAFLVGVVLLADWVSR